MKPLMFASEEASISRKRVRRRSIRHRITVLLILPLTSLAVVWAFAASLSLGEALDELEFTRIVDDVTQPIGLVGVALQQERAAATVVLRSNDHRGIQQLKTVEADTDAALSVFRATSLPSAEETLDNETHQLLRDLDRRYSGLKELRLEVQTAEITPNRGDQPVQRPL